MKLPAPLAAWVDDYAPADAARAGRARLELSRAERPRLRELWLSPREQQTLERIRLRWHIAEFELAARCW